VWRLGEIAEEKGCRCRAERSEAEQFEDDVLEFGRIRGGYKQVNDAARYGSEMRLEFCQTGEDVIDFLVNIDAVLLLFILESENTWNNLNYRLQCLLYKQYDQRHHRPK
jgi:hypothetical protein